MATSSSLTRRQWLPLIGLSAAAFVFNTSEFMPIGLLLDIGQSFALTESQTGIMISVYAWAVMLLSMPLMVLSSRFEFKKLLLGVIGLFTLGQFLSTIAPNFPFLIAARLVVATSHAIFWSIATIIAARLVDPKHQPIALSLIATGSSIAMIAGLPLGRMLGLAMGWRMTFASVGLISAAILLYLCLVMPKHEATERFTFRQLPSLLKNPILVSSTSSSPLLRLAIIRDTAISNLSWHKSLTCLLHSSRLRSPSLASLGSPVASSFQKSTTSTASDSLQLL